MVGHELKYGDCVGLLVGDTLPEGFDGMRYYLAAGKDDSPLGSYSL